MDPGLAEAIEDATSIDWRRRAQAVPVLAKAIGHARVDAALLRVLVEPVDLKPMCDAADAVLEQGSEKALRLYATAWHRVGEAEDWAVGDCHADALRLPTSSGSIPVSSWLRLSQDVDLEVASGASSIHAWLTVTTSTD